MHIY